MVPVSSSQGSQTPVEDLSYEQAFSELEFIVGELEAGKCTLDEALALFERGQQLARFCAALLERAELKVQQVSGSQLTDFVPEQ